jgi:hypothetical protein
MTVPNSDPPAAGTQKAIDSTQGQAERDRATIAALNARIRQLEQRARQLEDRAVEGTTTAQNYGGSSVA